MLWFEDMLPGRIDRYGAKRVTRDEVIDFAGKYDPQPFHLDDAAAALALSLVKRARDVTLGVPTLLVWQAGEMRRR